MSKTDTIKINGSEIVIVRTRLWGGGVNFCAYEPSVGGYASESHSSLYSIGGTVYGAVASRRIPAELDKMVACSTARYEAVHAFHEQNKRIAEGAILTACPEASDGVRTGGGDITVYPKR